MENKIGEKVRLFRNTVLRRTEIGNNCIIADDAFITDSHIGSYCTIERRSMIFNSRINDYSYTGYNTVVKHAKIGKFCSVSWNCSIGGANHYLGRLTTHPFPFTEKFGLIKNDTGGGYKSFNNPLIIGNDVWIAANVSITRGTVIADGAVVGAGSVVTHNIPPYEIWAGVPAKKIGQRFQDEVIAELIELKWWDAPYQILIESIDFFRSDGVTLQMIDELRSKMRE